MEQHMKLKAKTYYRTEENRYPMRHIGIPEENIYSRDVKKN